MRRFVTVEIRVPQGTAGKIAGRRFKLIEATPDTRLDLRIDGDSLTLLVPHGTAAEAKSKPGPHGG